MGKSDAAPGVMKAKKVQKKKDVKGLKRAINATTMTKDEFKKLQVGMEKKFPAPDYMSEPHPDKKGACCYRDQTFEIVTRWKAETKIVYRQHAKTPGSKSHVRYETYQKATTVGQALKLGSWPADWCWDYERGYIKVLGPVRDEPIDISSTANDKDFTDVDRAVYSWYRRELAKNLGLKLEELRQGKGSQESTIMRAHRLVAAREAKRILDSAAKEKRMITEEEVTAVLKEWAFAKNPNRTNVMQKGITWVWSDTLGLLRDRIGDIHISQASLLYPDVVNVLAKWLDDRLPAEAKGFKYTSFNVNKDYAAKIHRDGNNFGPSMISAFGDFTGGSLNYYPEDDGTQQDLTKLDVQESKFDLGKGLAMFNGNCAHSVDDFEGNRFSIVFFCLGCHAKMKPEDRSKLKEMGLPVPAPDEDPYTVLRAPTGRKNKTLYKSMTTSSGKKNLPSFRYWSKKELSSKKVVKKTK